MLVLGRKVGEKIHIGEDICLVVVQVRGNQVRLGFEAPLEVGIRRAEIDHYSTKSALASERDTQSASLDLSMT